MKTVTIIVVLLLSVAAGYETETGHDPDWEAVYDFHLKSADGESLNIETLIVEFKDFSGYSIPEKYLDKYSSRTLRLSNFGTDSSVVLFDFGYQGLFDWEWNYNQFGPYGYGGVLIQSVTMIPSNDSYREVTISDGEAPPEGTIFGDYRGTGLTLVTQGQSPGERDGSTAATGNISSFLDDYWWAIGAGVFFVTLLILLASRSKVTSDSSSSSWGLPIVLLLTIAALILWGTGMFEEEEKMTDVVNDGSFESGFDDSESSLDDDSTSEEPNEQKPLDLIVFVSDRDGDDEIFVMETDGGNQRQLTFNEDKDLSPTWSLNGDRIAFESGRYATDTSGLSSTENIYVMGSDGSNLTKLTATNCDSSPAWNHNDQRIAFESNRYEEYYDIFVMSANGNNQIKLTCNGNRHHYSPAWSPNGGRIAFTSFTIGIWEYEIFVMDADGRNQTQLTFNGGTSPSWGPDGNRITFTRDREIFIMNSDGRNQTQLTTKGGEHPDWSPDGKYIVFDSYRAGGKNIFVIDANGSNETQLTTLGGSFPDWGSVK